MDLFRNWLLPMRTVLVIFLVCVAFFAVKALSDSFPVEDASFTGAPIAR